MIAEHAAAVKTLMAALTVYPGRSPNDSQPPYVVQFTSAKSAVPSSLGAASDWREWRVVTQCVAAGFDAANVLADLVDTALLDRKPVVSGRVSSPLALESFSSAAPDEDVQDPTFTATSVWTFTTVPA